MTEVRLPTVRLVSAVLAKAEFPKAETAGKGMSLRVTRAGWRAWSIAGAVRVNHWGLTSAVDPVSRASAKAALGRYAKALEAHGWKVAEQGAGLAVLASEGNGDDRG